MTLAPAAISHLALSKFFSDVRPLAFSKTGPEPLKAVAEPGSALRNAPFADLCVEELDPEVRRVLFSQIPARTCRVTRTLGPQPRGLPPCRRIFPQPLGTPNNANLHKICVKFSQAGSFFSKGHSPPRADAFPTPTSHPPKPL
jgi:hypothetical protein